MPKFDKFSEAAWAALERHLPSDAPKDAREILEGYGRALWERRAGRMPYSSARSLTSALRKAEVQCRLVNWDERAGHLRDWMREAEQTAEKATAYRRNKDPDRDKFYSDVLFAYQGWGGDLGRAKEYVPEKAKRFFHEVCTAVIGQEAPKQASIDGVIRTRIKSVFTRINAWSNVKARRKPR